MRLIAVVLMLSLMFGCALVKTSGDLLCNPTEAQKLAAISAIAFIDAMLLAVDPGTSAYITWTKAKTIFILIKTGTCVTWAQVQEALNAVEQASLVDQGQAKMSGRPPLKKPDLSALKK